MPRDRFDWGVARDLDSPKRTRRSDEGRRVRVYLAQLAWLDGFRDGEGWRRIDTGESVEIDGARIAKARRAARTAVREHPRALRELVGDVERWSRIVDAKLAWLGGKAGFDPGGFLPPRVARALAQPGHAAAFALATAWLSDGELVERGLAWLSAHENELAHVSVRLACALARLALVGDGRGVERAGGVSALLALLAIDAPDPLAAVELNRNVENRLLGGASTTNLPQRSGPRVERWILELAARDSGHRQRALALIGVAQLAEALAPWQRWEREHAGLIARALELAGHTFDNAERAIHVHRVVAKLVRARNRTPEIVSLATAIAEIDMLASERLVRRHPAIVRLVAALPATMARHARVRMLLHAARIANTTDADDHVEWLWDALAQALVGGAGEDLLTPWQRALAASQTWIDTDLVEHAKRRADVERLVRLLGKLEQPSSDDANTLAQWLTTSLADNVVLELVRMPRAASTRIDDEIARACVALGDGTATDIAAIAHALCEVQEQLPWRKARRLAAFAQHAAQIGGAWLVRDALTSSPDRLVELADLAMALPASRRPALLAPANTDWVARYPAVLASALRRLATVDPDAERTAARRLATDLPDPRKLTQEIAVLRARHATGAAAKRLENLERRLVSPKLPSEKRLANLAVRLETSARELGLARWTAIAMTSASERFVRTFGLAEMPAWAQTPGVRELLFALLELEPADRELAGRLLRARNGPPPWDLRDEPKNREVLDRMRAANIDPAPWLDSTPRMVKTAAGKYISLALSDDPIEVFAMGAHFDTCLAPSGGNFFSVVANAADINKRVLYARRDGRVIGRCLFAITDALAMLAFHAYCHEQIDFQGIVRDFALDLAARMGTQLVARGSVSTLLARDWYDDGARDLVGRFGTLDDQFDFAAISPEQLVAQLCEALGHDLDNLTLPIVLGHRGFRGLPRHLAALVPHILASNVSQIRIDAAQLALDNGDRELADRLLGDHGNALVFESHAWPRGDLLGQLRPSETLARLRRSRPRSVHSWRDDRADRIALAGVALAALQRPRQAAALYRLAAQKEDWIEKAMHEKLAALGEPLAGELAK